MEVKISIELRDYQKECLESVIDEHNAGVSRQLLTLPTGAGKTIIMVAIAKEFDKRTLLLAHREELIDQAVEKFQLFWPGVSVGVCMAERNEIDAQIVVGSVQSCCRPKRLEQLKGQGFSVMMIDEAHHSASLSYQAVIAELGFNDNNSDKLLLGVTATPQRADKIGLGNTFDKVTFSRSISTMIRAGYLAPVIGRKILTNLTLRNVRVQNGDFAIGELSEVVNTPERNEFIASRFLEYAHDRKGIAFCCDVQHCKDLADVFQAQGINSKAVWGDMTDTERQSVLGDIKHGRIQVVTSCGILTKGYDEPSITAIVMARPTKSQGLYIQSIGRGLRLWPGKENCLVLDFTDRNNTLDSVMSLSSAIPEAKQISEDVQKEVDRELDTRPKIQVLKDVDNEFDILGATRFIWVDINDGEWSLQDDDKREIIMQPADGGYTAMLYYPDGSSKKIVNNPLPLEYAMGCAEDYARRHLKIKFVDLSKPWMCSTANPTQGQIDFLEKNGISCQSMNRGQASIEMRKIIAMKNKHRRQMADEPLTHKQKYFLKSAGVDTEGMSKLTAMREIAKLKQKAS